MYSSQKNGLQILLKAVQIRHLLMLSKQYDRKKGHFVQEFKKGGH